MAVTKNGPSWLDLGEKYPFFRPNIYQENNLEIYWTFTWQTSVSLPVYFLIPHKKNPHNSACTQTAQLTSSTQ
jgi:hypothetical protein